MLKSRGCGTPAEFAYVTCVVQGDRRALAAHRTISTCSGGTAHARNRAGGGGCDSDSRTIGLLSATVTPPIRGGVYAIEMSRRRTRDVCRLIFETERKVRARALRQSSGTNRRYRLVLTAVRRLMSSRADVAPLPAGHGRTSTDAEKSLLRHIARPAPKSCCGSCDGRIRSARRRDGGGAALNRSSTTKTRREGA